MGWGGATDATFWGLPTLLSLIRGDMVGVFDGRGEKMGAVALKSKEAKLSSMRFAELLLPRFGSNRSSSGVESLSNETKLSFSMAAFSRSNSASVMVPAMCSQNLNSLILSSALVLAISKKSSTEVEAAVFDGFNKVILLG